MPSLPFHQKITPEHVLLQMRKEAFFRKDCRDVARRLLGDVLMIKKGRTVLAGKIVETEAYPGKEDDASHTHGGKMSERTRPLYSRGGISYVYFIYGKYWCFNIVTGRENDPQSVFIRALEPLAGLETMKKLRAADDPRMLTGGPCRWTQAFGIDRSWSGRSLCAPSACVLKGRVEKKDLVSATRIGIGYADKGKHELLRFYIRDNIFVSKK